MFRWLKKSAKIPGPELARVFNCGIGMVAIAHSVDAAEAQTLLEAQGEVVHRIGQVVRRAEAGPAVVIRNMDAAWRG